MLQDYRNDMIRCGRCSVCKYIPGSSVFKSWRFANGCPSIKYYKFHTYSGGGRLVAALSLLEERVSYSPAFLDVVYGCTLCGLCDLSCRLGTDLEVLEILHELRVKCVDDGVAPLPAHKAVLENLKKYSSIWNPAGISRDAWARGLGIKDLSKGEKANVLYYVGCTYACKPEMQKIPQLTARLFKKAGVDFGILAEKEPCCANIAYMAGDKQLFEEQARKNIALFNGLGVSKIVISCASCFGMMKAKYPLFGEEMNFTVLHAGEFLAQLLNEGKLKLTRSVPLQVTYHDPCHLGRLSEPRFPSGGIETRFLGSLPVKEVPKVLGLEGVYDPPRELLEAVPGVRLLEMERRREYSWCCGAGGGVKFAYPGFALATAQERLAEARAAGAETLVTSCPWCEKNFCDAIQESRVNLKVLNIVELLNESVE